MNKIFSLQSQTLISDIRHAQGASQLEANHSQRDKTVSTPFLSCTSSKCWGTLLLLMLINLFYYNTAECVWMQSISVAIEQNKEIILKYIKKRLFFHTTKLKAWPKNGGTFWTVYKLYFYTPKNDWLKTSPTQQTREFHCCYDIPHESLTTGREVQGWPKVSRTFPLFFGRGRGYL